MLVFVRGVGAVYVCDQSGDEANLINQMVSDRSKTGGYGYRTSRATFLLEGLKIMSRDYVSGRGSRDVWTSDAALVGGGSETSGLATQLVWGVGAETFAFDAALEGGGTETYCTSDAAYVYIYPYEEMRVGVLLLKSVVCVFSIPIPHGVTPLLLTPPIPLPFQMRLTSRSDCYWAGALGILSL
ncbi:hypothetical protein YC2023_067282 [Brassica napus]